jgi:hypothetical protein
MGKHKIKSFLHARYTRYLGRCSRNIINKYASVKLVKAKPQYTMND